MKFRNDLEDVEQFESLMDDISLFSSRGIRPGLRRITGLLRALGEPQKKFCSIQVLGTNGKGSVAATIEAILLAGGMKTALYTSPHLISLQERLRVNGRYLPAGEWRSSWERVRNAVAGDAELDADRPSFFENLTALCILLIKDASVDMAVMEAGMGGRYDATSVCGAMAAVINPIGMDHTRYLGSTLEAVAREKFAAVKNGKHAFYAGDDESLAPIFTEECASAGAIPHLLDSMARPKDIACTLDRTVFSYESCSGTEDAVEIPRLETPLLGKHQAFNAVRAIAVLLSLKDKLPAMSFIEAGVIRKGLERTDWPGRLELFRREGAPSVILDGAHNEHAARTLISSISSLEKPREKGVKIKIGAVVLAVMADKDILQILRAIRDLECPVYCAEIPSEQRSAAAGSLSELAGGIGMKVGGCFSEPSEALEAASEAVAPHELVLCCGSLFLVGNLRRLLRYKGKR
jgi:dihydrofolate synthase/folylpolyglutamate synthase